MDSIKSIYKTGLGPSSSHTMGPSKAASLFKAVTPDAGRYRVTLFGSLAATGRGHFTDKAIADTLAPSALEIIWRADVVPQFHTNGMLFEALDSDGAVMASHSFYSVGGGNLSDGPALDDGSRDCGPLCAGQYDVAQNVYKHNTCTELMHHMSKHGVSFWEHVEYCEGASIWEYLSGIWEQMQSSVKEGLAEDRVLPGGLKVKSKAKQYFIRAKSLRPSLQSRALVTAYSLAVSEQNARGKMVATAPTCGSCGVVPGVLYHLKTAHDFSDEEILKALATAGLFGDIIKTNASISGAEVGCQGEIGSACVMAAVAATQLFGGTTAQIECAAEMAMEHNLGLTCDPVCGMVQIPCIERNPIAALRALDVSLYSLLNDGNHLISFDKVVETMKKTGRDLPSLYKETALGGLAALKL